MVPWMSLWLPILLSAVAVFLLSSVVHMVLPYHRSDYKKVPSEDAVMEKVATIAATGRVAAANIFFRRDQVIRRDHVIGIPPGAVGSGGASEMVDAPPAPRTASVVRRAT